MVNVEESATTMSKQWNYKTNATECPAAGAKVHGIMHLSIQGSGVKGSRDLDSRSGEKK